MFCLQEFCLFAVVGLVSDFFLQMLFFTTVLSIDIRRMEVRKGLRMAFCFGSCWCGETKGSIPCGFRSLRHKGLGGKSSGAGLAGYTHGIGDGTWGAWVPSGV